MKTDMARCEDIYFCASCHKLNKPEVYKIRKEKFGYFVSTSCGYFIVDDEEIESLLRQTQNKCVYPTKQIDNYSRPFISPIVIKWDVTYACNLKCKHCYSDSSTTRDYGPATEDFFKIISIISDTGVFFIQFLGGEPFYRKDFLKILYECKDRNLVTCINTNGTLINDSMVNELEKLDVDAIEISIHGIGHVHDEFTSCNGAFKKSAQTLKKIGQLSINTGVVCTLHKRNIHQIDEIAKLAFENGAKTLQFNMLTMVGRGTNCDEYLLNSEDIRLLRSEINKIVQQYPDMNIVIPHVCVDTKTIECQINNDQKEDMVIKYGCQAGVYGLSMTPFGDLYLCNQVKTSVGNVLHEDPFELYERAFKIKTKLVNKKCLSCNFFKNGTCWGFCLREALEYNYREGV